MRKLVTRWTLLYTLIAATLVGVEHRLATLPPQPPPILVSAAAVSLP